MKKSKPNPMQGVVKDLAFLAKLAIEGSIHAPDFHRDLIHKKAKQVLSKYVFTRRRINALISKAGIK